MMAHAEPTKLFTVISYNPDFRRPEVEATFSTYEKAAHYINQLFENAEHTARSIVETYLDPWEDELSNNNYYFFIAAYLQDKYYQIEVDKTSDHIFYDQIERFKIHELGPNETPEISYYCFARSSKEAYEKFCCKINDYLEEKKLIMTFAEPRFNQQSGYF